jgi:hypothetical protein
MLSNELEQAAKEVAQEITASLHSAMHRLNDFHDLNLEEVDCPDLCRTLTVLEKAAQELLELPSGSPGCVSDEMFLIICDIHRTLHGLGAVAGDFAVPDFVE